MCLAIDRFSGVWEALYCWWNDRTRKRKYALERIICDPLPSCTSYGEVWKLQGTGGGWDFEFSMGIARVAGAGCRKASATKVDFRRSEQ
jgi:hypothetical protein